jgi:hypothetical protein
VGFGNPSRGQQARLRILLLELRGSTLLALDEPTAFHACDVVAEVQSEGACSWAWLPAPKPEHEATPGQLLHRAGHLWPDAGTDEAASSWSRGEMAASPGFRAGTRLQRQADNKPVPACRTGRAVRAPQAAFINVDAANARSGPGCGRTPELPIVRRGDAVIVVWIVLALISFAFVPVGPFVVLIAVLASIAGRKTDGQRAEQPSGTPSNMLPWSRR